MGDTLINLDFEKVKHLSYEERRINVPKSFVLTEYHAVLLYADHIKAVCLLNQEQVYHEVFDEVRVGKLLNIERDVATGAIYVYTDKAVFTLKITREERNIWRIYLSRGQYIANYRYYNNNNFRNQHCKGVNMITVFHPRSIYTGNGTCS